MVALPGAAHGQIPLTTRGAALYESYSFKPASNGLALSYKRISELTVPLGADVRIGRRGSFAIATGFANVQLVTNDALQLPNQTVSGLLDTEVRLSWNVLPGKLIAVATGVIPTGSKTVDPQQLAVLGAISSDLIGYSASSLGSGGNVGGGLIGAVPLGKFSAGLGATYKQSMSYQPLSSDSNMLLPGTELRLRAGLEGNLARRTFLRAAAIVAQSTPDKLSGATRNGVGTRIIAYLSVNQSFGKASITVYGFDVYRGGPQIQDGNAAILPKGNLIAGGARMDYALNPRTTISPRLEYRGSAAAPDASGGAVLQRLGSSFRFGVDARQQIKTGMAAVLQAGGAAGSILQSGSSIPFSGLRIALSFEFTP